MNDKQVGCINTAALSIVNFFVSALIGNYLASIPHQYEHKTFVLCGVTFLVWFILEMILWTLGVFGKPDIKDMK